MAKQKKEMQQKCGALLICMNTRIRRNTQTTCRSTEEI